MKAVCKYIHGNPTATQKTIAEETSLTQDQVKHCLAELKRAGHVVDGFIVDPTYLGYRLRYRIDIFLQPGKLRDGKGGLPEDPDINSQKSLARYILNRLPNKSQFRGKVLVEDVQILLGHPADLSATVRATDSDAMLEFVTEGLRMCQAVTQTTSCLQAWSCKDGNLSGQEFV